MCSLALRSILLNDLKVHSICANSTLRFMLHAFVFLGMEMSFTSTRKAHCVLAYARTQSNKTVQRL